MPQSHRSGGAAARTNEKYWKLFYEARCDFTHYEWEKNVIDDNYFLNDFSVDRLLWSAIELGV